MRQSAQITLPSGTMAPKNQTKKQHLRGSQFNLIAREHPDWQESNQ
jgi:hypothetical protein